MALKPAIPTTLYQDLDVYRGRYSVPELQKIRRTLAKRANQRMVRLERARGITGEKFSEFGAITDAYEYLRTQKKGSKRFQESAKAITDINDLRREITILQGFLGRKTSLVSGIRQIENKRTQTFASGKWGTGYKWTGQEKRQLLFSTTKEFYDFLNSQTFKDLISRGFTSEQVIEIYDSAREKREHEEIMQELEKAVREYKEKQNATLQDLIKRTGAKKLV